VLLVFEAATLHVIKPAIEHDPESAAHCLSLFP